MKSRPSKTINASACLGWLMNLTGEATLKTFSTKTLDHVALYMRSAQILYTWQTHTFNYTIRNVLYPYVQKS